MKPYLKDFWECGENDNSNELRKNYNIVVNSWANNMPLAPVDKFEDAHFPTSVFNTLTIDMKFIKPTSIQMQHGHVH